MVFFTAWELLGILIVSSVVYILLIVTYRITFHPLAKYPGPLLARISGWPDALSAIRGTRHTDIHQLHVKYGDVVRYAPNSVSFITAAAVHDIYTNRHANVVKTGWTAASIELNKTISTHTMPDRKLHAVKRRLLSQAFSESALRSAEAYVLSRIRAWCRFVGGPPESKDWSDPKDIGHWSTLLTLDILGELCFGKSFNAMEASRHMITYLIIAGGKAIQSVSYMPIRRLLFPLLSNLRIAGLIGGQLFKDRLAFRVQMRKLVDERRDLETKHKNDGDSINVRKDFFHYLLHAKDPETGTALSDKELEGEAALMVAAGMDTSSTTLSALFFYLTKYPDVLAKLTTVLRGSFADVEEIVSGPDLSSQTYLRACIDETLRMTPPLPGILSRIALPGGVTVDGKPFPVDTVVGVSAYAIHHNEAYFPESFVFRPERWIEGDATTLERMYTAFIPFSVGPRGCVGKNLAYMELLTATARLVWQYDVRGVDGGLIGGVWSGGDLEYPIKDRFIAEREGPFVELKARR